MLLPVPSKAWDLFELPCKIQRQWDRVPVIVGRKILMFRLLKTIRTGIVLHFSNFVHGSFFICHTKRYLITLQ